MEGGEESDDHDEYNFISASTVLFVANSAAASFFPKSYFNNESSFFQKF